MVTVGVLKSGPTEKDNFLFFGTFICFCGSDRGPMAVIEDETGRLWTYHASMIKVLKREPLERRTVLD